MFQKLIGDERAAVSIIAALSLAAVVGVSALAVEFGHGLLARSENQRVADLAAYGGALVYNSTGSATEAAGAAANIAALNGVASGAAANVVSSPTGDGNEALEMSVVTSMPLYLARVFTTKTSLSVGATAYAEMKASAPGCIIALSGAGSGISLSGGTSVTADNCAVASNSAVTLVGGTKITTKVVDYSTSYSVTGGSSIVTPAGGSPTYSKTTTADPLAGNSAVSTAAARVNSVAGIASPSPPSVTIPSGSAVSFKTSGVTGLSNVGACTDTYNAASKVYTVTCTGTADFGAITVSGVSVTLNTSTGNTYNFASQPPSSFTIAGSGGTYGFNYSLSPSGTTTYPAGTYNINGSITPGGGATTNFGAGTYTVSGGFVAGGGSTTTFGAGTYSFGTASCNGSTYSICNTGTTLTFDGPSTFTLAGGVHNGGGAVLYLGYSTSSGITNSFDIGKSGDGYAIDVGTSKTMLLGNTGDSGDTFTAVGTISSGGGSCLQLPPASEHDVNGNMDFSGGVYLGAGIYTMDGYFAMGKSSGGDVSNCPTSGTTTGLNATGVTLVVSGTQSVTCNGVASSAFCLGAGYSTVDLTAPSSGTTADLAVIGPQSASYPDAAAFTTGATNTQISGAFYFPHGPVTMSGAAALADAGNPNACLELIGTQVSLAGGSAAASTCTGLGGGSTGSTVALVQ